MASFDIDPQALYDRKQIGKLTVPQPLPDTSPPDVLSERDRTRFFGNLNTKMTAMIATAVRVTLPYTFSQLQTRKQNYRSALNNPARRQNFYTELEIAFDERFRDREPNPYTTVYYTADNVLVLVYAAHQNPEPDRQYSYHNQPALTDLMLWKTRNPGAVLHYHGIPRNQVLSHWRDTQHCVSALKLDPPRADDRRHRVDIDRSLQVNYYFRHRGPTGNGPVQAEGTGTSHLVECRPQRGHPKAPMTPSKDYSRTATSHVAAAEWLRSSWKIQQQLRKMTHSFFPEYYEESAVACKAAITRNSPVVGPWIGKAIVWKLQGSSHIDDHDIIPTATYPMGVYEGGYMDLIDIDTRLYYRPGDIILGWTEFLFHRVSQWTVPATISLEDQRVMSRWGLTPGRVGIVNFFTDTAYEMLKDKPAHWGPITLWGRIPYPEEVGKKRKRSLDDQGSHDKSKKRL
ncbi:hypothetical protein PQX77_020853 [Marasmius sp. AFHP31]|nr:hypothetical protein PQX77_020853 [Marasmius sp. AFHP31]